MTEHTETNLSTNDESCSYTPPPGDPGAYKLMATINGEQRKAVRVLRSWRLRSPLSPVGGIRYDGLYVYTALGLYVRSSGAHTGTGIK